VDPVAELLSEVRSEGAAVGHLTWTPPWRIHVTAKIPLAVITVLRGEVALVSNQHPYWIADSLASDSAPHLIAHTAMPDGRVEIVNTTQPPVSDSRIEIVNIAQPPVSDVRHAVDAAGQTTLLLANYQVRGRISLRLLKALPQLLVVSGSERVRPVLAMTSSEVEKEEPGQQAVLDRLLDLLLLVCLREWFARADADQPGWVRALSDPVLGPALRMLYAQPNRGWTVDDLAAAATVSRATFSRRFTTLVGEPPMKYLTRWRLALAEDLLTRTDATVESIARRVGYSTAFSLSAALKREHGLRPSSLRRSTAR
jgi:AraC-like DNA-binding protein